MTEERVRELVHAELTEYHDEIRREGGGEGGVEGGGAGSARGQSRTGRGGAVSEGRDFFFGVNKVDYCTVTLAYCWGRRCR